MKREYHRWLSPALGRDMELLVFGDQGARVLVFPTSMGRFYDWEDRGMIGALGDYIQRGSLQLFCVDSVDAETWYSNNTHPSQRARRHDQFDHYLVSEVLPFSVKLNSNPFVVAAGASFGGYHAINFGLRHADKVNRVLSMSGLCDVRRFLDGYYDENVYFNNPVDYLSNEHEPSRLDALRSMDIILAVGRDDGLLASNRHLSDVLWSKDIWHALRVWDGFAHDWPVWQKMVRLYISGHD
jgi:esterase/lipase superfamily enzyme